MMKKIFHLITSAVIMLAVCSCDNIFRDELNEIHSEIDVLQKIITALQSNDYVTDVTPVIENGW
jgi:hypothetical protein